MGGWSLLKFTTCSVANSGDVKHPHVHDPPWQSCPHLSRPADPLKDYIDAYFWANCTRDAVFVSLRLLGS